MGIVGWIKSFGENTLYYPGCLTKIAMKEQLENYKKVFNILGVDFIMLPEIEVCCGLPILNAGYEKEARELAKKNLEIFKKNKISKIITNCPSCFHTFRDVYPKFVPEWDIKVEHATITILNGLKKKGIDFRKKNIAGEIVTYHDSCHLGRYCGIYEEPREVIQRLGGEIIEMKHNRKNSICCGAGAGVRANYPELAKSIAKKRAKEIPLNADKVVSACGLCHSNILTASDKSEEFSSFVLRRLNLR
jgi:heterodisulfide reductase subunit D